MSNRRWWDCFGCGKGHESDPDTYAAGEQSGPSTYLIEKLNVKKVPYHMFATPEDLSDLSPASRSKVLAIRASQVPENDPNLKKQSLTTLHTRTPDVRFQDKRRSSDLDEEELEEKRKRERLRKAQTTKSLTSIVSRTSERRGHFDTDSNHGARPKQIITKMSESNATKVPKNLSDLQIGPEFLNQYSSIFTHNLKDPIPKDPNPVNASNKVKKKALNVPRSLKVGKPALVVKRSVQPQVSHFSAMDSRYMSSDEESDEEEEEEEEMHCLERFKYDTDKRGGRRYHARYADVQVRPVLGDEKEMTSHDLDLVEKDIAECDLGDQKKGKRKCKIIIRHKKKKHDADTSTNK